MKANMPKIYNQLTPSEQRRINQALEDAMDRELCDAQIIWIKMACSILHDMGLSVDDIVLFVGNWRRMYRANSRLRDQAEQDVFLAERMARIFGEGGFPEEFVQALREIGRE